MRPLPDQDQATLIEWTLPMQSKELRCKPDTEPTCHHEQETPHVFTRRNFVKRTSTAITALAFGATALISNKAKAAAPVWTTIPDQLWRVGESVHLDLSNFVTDADGDTLSYQLDVALPPGLTISGSIISGVPTSEFSPAEFTAAASDGTDEVAPNPPTGLTIS
jgi:hypothetical protein